MERTEVQSSNLKSVGYDPTTSTLEVEFNGGSVYQYNNVPVSEYDGLMKAQSHGKYFVANVKNRYKYIQL